MKKIETEVTIEATAKKVWQVLTNFEDYPKWNPFIRRISGSRQEGEKLEVFLKPPESKGMTFHPKVKKSEPGKEFSWKGRLGLPGIFDGEHYFIIKEVSSKRTHLTHGEKFSGLLIPFMGNIFDKTREGFELMNKTLKKECERQEKPARVKNSVSENPGAG
ncbi:MAG: SRPBCC family protein [Mariniphaga sp.]